MPDTTVKESRYSAPSGVAGSSVAGLPAPAAAPVVPRRGEATSLVGRTARGIARWARAAAVTIAAVYLLGVIVVPATITMFARSTWYAAGGQVVLVRAATTDVVRPFAPPADPSIGAEQAGITLSALEMRPPSTPSRGFTFRDVRRLARPDWLTSPLPAGLFPTARPPGGGLPHARAVLDAVRNGVSPAERAVLRGIATDPIWREVDQVARAGAVDVIGGRLVVPFPEDAQVAQVPRFRSSVPTIIGAASVSRAAWHLAEGRADSAIAALGMAIGFGRAIQDNAILLGDAAAGGAIVNEARDALIKLFVVTGDPRAVTVRDAVVRARNGVVTPKVFEYTRDRPSFDDARVELLGIVRNPQLPRAVRVDALRSLNLQTCGSMREVLFGPRQEVRDAVAALRAQLVYPSERAVLDLIAGELGPGLATQAFRSQPQLGRAAAMLGRIYFNPRIAACTPIALGFR